MIRNSAAAILACLFVACSIWIVGNEGLAYRDSLRRAKLAELAAEQADRASPLPAETVKPPTAETSPEIATSRLEPPVRKPAGAAAGSPSAEPPRDHSHAEPHT